MFRKHYLVPNPQGGWNVKRNGAERASLHASHIITVLALLVVLAIASTVDAKEPTTNLYYYKKNAAFTEFVKHVDEYEKLDEYEFASKKSKHPELNDLKHYKAYRLWAVYLVKHGIKIKDQLDYMTVELNKYNDTANSDTKPIELILQNTIKMLESKRNFEVDAEEYIHTFISTGIADKSDQISSISLITNEINRSYDRVFNLATYKLNNISNSKTTETNIALSKDAIYLSKVAIIISIAIGAIQTIVSCITIFTKK